MKNLNTSPAIFLLALVISSCSAAVLPSPASTESGAPPLTPANQGQGHTGLSTLTAAALAGRAASGEDDNAGGTLLGAVAANVPEVVEEALSGMQESAVEAVGNVADKMANAVDAARDAVSEAASGASGGSSSAVGLADVVEDMQDTIADVVADKKDAVTDVVDDMRDTIADVAGGKTESAAGAVEDMKDKMADASENQKEAMEEAVEDMQESIADAGKDKQNTVADDQKTIIANGDDMQGSIDDAPGDLGGSVDDNVDDMQGTIEDAVENMQDTMADKLEDIQGSIDDVVENQNEGMADIVDGLQDGIEDRHDAAADAVSDLQDMLQDMTDKTGDIIDINLGGDTGDEDTALTQHASNEVLDDTMDGVEDRLDSLQDTADDAAEIMTEILGTETDQDNSESISNPAGLLSLQPGGDFQDGNDAGTPLKDLRDVINDFVDDGVNNDNAENMVSDNDNDLYEWLEARAGDDLAVDNNGDDVDGRDRSVAGFARKISKVKNWMDVIDAQLAESQAAKTGTCPIYPVRVNSDRITITTVNGCKIEIKLKGASVESIYGLQENLTDGSRLDRAVEVSYSTDS